VTDQAYCPTCETEQLLVMREDVGKTLEHFTKECSGCHRPFTSDNLTYVLRDRN
jgi:hypothetical protein